MSINGRSGRSGAELFITGKVVMVLTNWEMMILLLELFTTFVSVDNDFMTVFPTTGETVLWNEWVSCKVYNSHLSSLSVTCMGEFYHLKNVDVCCSAIVLTVGYTLARVFLHSPPPPHQPSHIHINHNGIRCFYGRYASSLCMCVCVCVCVLLTIT